MAAAIGIKGAEQAILGDRLMNAAKAAVGAFLGAEKGRYDLAGGIVQRHHQIAMTLAKPEMLARILMDHHPPHRPPGTAQPVRPAALHRGDQPGLQQHQPRPGIAPEKAVIALRKLVKVSHVEAPVPIAIKLRHLLDLRVRRPPLRHLANSAILQPASTLLVIPVPKPQKMPHTASKDQRRFLAAQPILL
jgi:hypothetical protein